MIEIFKSNKPNKKFYVIYNDNKIYFGAPNYEHYTEGHLDIDRKKRYLTRATKIKDKYGDYTYKNPLSANFWAVFFLWYEDTYRKAGDYIGRLLGEKVKLNF